MNNADLKKMVITQAQEIANLRKIIATNESAGGVAHYAHALRVIQKIQEDKMNALNTNWCAHANSQWWEYLIAVTALSNNKQFTEMRTTKTDDARKQQIKDQINIARYIVVKKMTFEQAKKKVWNQRGDYIKKFGYCSYNNKKVVA